LGITITSRVFVPKIFGEASLREFLAQKSLAEHHIKSFCPKNPWRSITSRFFVPNIFGEASHREFLFQNTLEEHYIKSF
jgi:hypothetical protein